MYNARLWVCRIVALVVLVLWGLLLNFWTMPAMTLASAGTWFFFAIGIFGVGTLFFLLAEWIAGEEEWHFSIGSLIIAGVMLVIMFFVSIPSWTMFNASAYQRVITIKMDGDAQQDLPKVEKSKDVPSVDMLTARQLGDRTMGAMEKYASQYEVNDEYNPISYQGDYIRISPLEYGDYFKYMNSKKDGIPGYVMVDIYTQEAKFVTLKEPMRYSPSASFGDKLKRHLRGLYPSYIFGKEHFEIDEEGVPYYIVPVETPTVSFNAHKVTSVILLNAVTGDGKEYDINEVPEWVDHVFSVSYIMERVEWYCGYINGFWNNSIFGAKKDVRKTSYSFVNTQYFFVPMKDDMYLYTGITSAGKDESNVGFILANMRTGEITYYSDPGAEESSAQSSAQGLVQHLGYTAGPVMEVTVDGIPTYFMSLKDAGGLVKKYAFVNKPNYAIASEGDTVEQALKVYRSRIRGENVSLEQADAKEGMITFLATAVKEGTTFFYFKLEGDDTLYVSSLLTNEKQVTMAEGIKLSINYSMLDDGFALVQQVTIK